MNTKVDTPQFSQVAFTKINSLEAESTFEYPHIIIRLHTRIKFKLHFILIPHAWDHKKAIIRLSLCKFPQHSNFFMRNKPEILSCFHSP